MKLLIIIGTLVVCVQTYASTFHAEKYRGVSSQVNSKCQIDFLSYGRRLLAVRAKGLTFKFISKNHDNCNNEICGEKSTGRHRLFSQESLDDRDTFESFNFILTEEKDGARHWSGQKLSQEGETVSVEILVKGNSSLIQEKIETVANGIKTQKGHSSFICEKLRLVERY